MVEEKAIFRKAKNKAERRYEENFNKWREYDLLTAIIAVVGLMISIVDWEYTRDTSEKIISDPVNFKRLCGFEDMSRKAECQETILEMRRELSESNWLRVIIVLVSLFGIITLYMRHLVKARWLNEDLPAELMKNAYILGDAS